MNGRWWSARVRPQDAPRTVSRAVMPRGVTTESSGYRMFGSNHFRVRTSRVIRDPAGFVVWRVVEVDTTGLPGARRDACLLFDGAQGVRRVWHYPANWDTLSDAELLALSWST